MVEYIEREMSLKTIDEYFHTTDPDGDEQIGVLKSRKIIRTLPAADVAPVRHGRWELTGADKRGRGGNWKCTGRDGCGKSYPYKCDFCPNCGAKMDLEIVHPG